MPNNNASRAGAALLGMCHCCRCNPAEPRLQSAGINIGWFLECPTLPANSLKGRPQGFASPTPLSSQLRERKLLDDPTTFSMHSGKALVTVCTEWLQ